jgi:alpha-mannosidase
MILYTHSRRIDFETHVNWQESHKLLKAAFYTDIRATKATYDIQFGHVERPTHWNTSWDLAKFEVCGHKWADLSETDYGISLLNNCKYGHSIKDGVMRLSLLRSPKNPDTVADMGEHHFTYSLYPHGSTVVHGGTIEEANALNQPPQVIPGRFYDERRIVVVDSPAVQIDAVKKAEDDDAIVVRIHECRGSRARFTLSSDYPIRKIVPCNLLEHSTGSELQQSSITDVLHPFQIQTYKLYFR